ncbi:MAG: vanadium-dependent haloperoxidase [Panacibacter sp.]
MNGMRRSGIIFLLQSNLVSVIQHLAVLLHKAMLYKSATQVKLHSNNAVWHKERTHRFMRRYLVFLVSAFIVFTACTTTGNSDYVKLMHDPLLYSKTVKRLNDIVLENNFPPMIASRNYAYANIAAYEVMAAGDSSYISLAGQITLLPAMPKPGNKEQVDFPFASLIAFCKVGNAVTFPEGSMDIYVEELKKKAEDAGMPSDIFSNSIAYANAVADSILSWSKKDNYLQTRSASKYTITNEPGTWQPTPPAYAQGVEPHWREIRTLVLDSASQFKPARPPKFDVEDKNGVYYKAVMEVKNIVDSLTPEQKQIADFWDDNPFKLNVVGHVMYGTKKFSPPGHWMNIVGIIAQKQHSDFSETVCAYTKTGIALFDAFISCWDEKYRSNYIRPETVINKYFSPEWQPYIQTPPFPEYTSGHAVISAAAAEVMTSIFGENISYTDSSELEFGIPNRSFTSVKAAAEEASISRVYGGIHYKYSCQVGAEEGKLVGILIDQRLQMKKK